MAPTLRSFLRAAPLLACWLVPASTPADEVRPPERRADDKLDLNIVHRIKSEATRNGKVMDHLFWLTDHNGPRLTNSPGYRRAAAWAVQSLNGWGAGTARLEKWGPFGRGWSLGRSSLRLHQPVDAPLSGAPRAWSGGTNGPVTGEPILAPLFLWHEWEDRGDLTKLSARIQQYCDQHRGKLRGRIVLLTEARDLDPPKDPASTRLDDPKLHQLNLAPDAQPPVPWEWPLLSLPQNPKRRAALWASVPTQVMFDYWDRTRNAMDPLLAFFRQEGVVAVFATDRRGDGGLIFSESMGSWNLGAPIGPPVATLAPEAYNRLVRLLEHKVPTRVEVDIEARFHEESGDGENVIAEIPGRRKRDEVVMLGAHLDSWHTATGATDNAVGVAVVLEAFRILKTLDLPMDRTVRLALWGGEEQGLYGSRGYVRQHFADPVTMATKPEHSKLSAYFNLDNGSGRIRGVYLQGNDMVRPIFDAWLSPFRDEGASTVSIRNAGGTDHLSFDAVGLPGFQFIQDPLDYGTRTHHSDIDVYDRAPPADLMQASAIMATFVYAAATRDAPLPRKPLPKALPKPTIPVAGSAPAAPNAVPPWTPTPH